ncbi:hypothetical protein CJF31_00008501 [Rutstroemia sp. NJR-2017a BVV2]|nr:hypothetical protein CJF31_00008501 [Rutstroemia sp. NJR-2017a BVV2]
MISEYDNIANGRPVQHPNQFRPAPGSGEAAAVKVFQEACGRTMMVQMIVNDTSGRMAIMTGSSGPPMDYGESVKQAVADLDKAIPDEHKMAGMLG